jgi:hypothetical protein
MGFLLGRRVVPLKPEWLTGGPKLGPAAGDRYRSRSSLRVSPREENTVCCGKQEEGPSWGCEPVCSTCLPYIGCLQLAAFAEWVGTRTKYGNATYMYKISKNRLHMNDTHIDIYSPMF